MLGIGGVDAEIHDRWNNLSGVSCASRGAPIAFGFLDCSFRANRVFTWLRGILYSLHFIFFKAMLCLDRTPIVVEVIGHMF